MIPVISTFEKEANEALPHRQMILLRLSLSHSSPSVFLINSVILFWVSVYAAHRYMPLVTIPIQLYAVCGTVYVYHTVSQINLRLRYLPSLFILLTVSIFHYENGKQHDAGCMTTCSELSLQIRSSPGPSQA